MYFKEKLRMGDYPQVWKKGQENSQNKGKQLRGIKVLKDRRHVIVGRATNIQEHKETI